MHYLECQCDSWQKMSWHPWACAGEFMLARYREVVETVLRFRDSKEKLIRRAVIALIPRLAAFAPERFAATYLRVCSEHLLGVLR